MGGMIEKFPAQNAADHINANNNFDSLKELHLVAVSVIGDWKNTHGTSRESEHWQEYNAELRIWIFGAYEC